MTIQVVVWRVGADPRLRELVQSVHTDLYGAVAARQRVVAAYQRDGFRGGRNSTGTWRLSKRENGKRIRLAVFLRELPRSPN